MTQLEASDLINLIKKQVEFSNENLENGNKEIAAYHAGCATVYALMCGERLSKYGLHYYGDCEYSEQNNQVRLEVF